MPHVMASGGMPSRPAVLRFVTWLVGDLLYLVCSHRPPRVLSAGSMMGISLGELVCSAAPKSVQSQDWRNGISLKS